MHGTGTLSRRPATLAALPDILSEVVQSPCRDAACCGFSIAGAVALVKTFDLLATQGIIDQVHMPMYCLDWHMVTIWY